MQARKEPGRTSRKDSKGRQAGKAWKENSEQRGATRMNVWMRSTIARRWFQKMPEELRERDPWTGRKALNIGRMCEDNILWERWEDKVMML